MIAPRRRSGEPAEPYRKIARVTELRSVVLSVLECGDSFAALSSCLQGGLSPRTERQSGEESSHSRTDKITDPTESRPDQAAHLLPQPRQPPRLGDVDGAQLDPAEPGHLRRRPVFQH